MNISLELTLPQHRTARRLRRGRTQYANVFVPARGTVNLTTLLGLDAEATIALLEGSPHVQRYRKKALLDWVVSTD